MPASEPPTSVVDKYEELREFLPELEDFGAKHEDLDLLNEVLGDSEYQALGEVYDILSMQLPEAEDGGVTNLVQDVIEVINTDYRPPKHAREIRNIFTDCHFKAFLEAYEDVVTKAYVSDNDDYRLPPESDGEEDITRNDGYNGRAKDVMQRKEDRPLNTSIDRDDRRREDEDPRRREDPRRDDRNRDDPRRDDKDRDDRKRGDRRREDRDGRRHEDDRKSEDRDSRRSEEKDDRRSEERDDRRSEEREDRRRPDRNNRRSEDRDDDRRDRKPHSSYYPPAPVFDQYHENQRFVILKKSGNEPLGITVRQDESDSLFVAKIRQNSLADKQSRLQVGDFVKEVNGEPVYEPEDLMAILKDVEEWIIIKIVPFNADQYSSAMTYLKACVTYNSMTDRLIPYKKVGLSYNTGDMLAVLDDSDENWWQARMADDPAAPIGLIPSRTLQEKRHVYVQPETAKAKSSLLCGMGRKKKKVGYDAANAGEYEDGHVKIYEEVMLTDTCRLSLVLVGVDKECTRTLKERLIREFPTKYSTVVPETSRPMKPKDKQGKGFIFVDPDDMKSDLKKHSFIEEGEYNGHWYGLRLSAVREVAQSGRMCILDVAPENLKTLMTQEYRPLVVFIAAPRWEQVKSGRNKYKKQMNNNNMDDNEDDSILEDKCRELEHDSNEMKRRYRGSFDEVIINDGLDHTYQNLVHFLQDVTSRGDRWVPKKWGKTI